HRPRHPGARLRHHPRPHRRRTRPRGIRAGPLLERGGAPMTATTATRIQPLPLPIVRRWLADGWRGMLGWALGIIATLALYLPIYPSMQSPELNALLESLPEELVRTLGYESITTGAGYTEATFFGLVGFVLVAIAATAWGAAYTGGAEESGRLELTLSHAVGRGSFAVQSALALLIKLLIL